MFLNYDDLLEEMALSDEEMDLLNIITGDMIMDLGDSSYLERTKALKDLKRRRNEIPEDIYNIMANLDFYSEHCAKFAIILAYTKGYLDSGKGQPPVEILEFMNSTHL